MRIVVASVFLSRFVRGEYLDTCASLTASVSIPEGGSTLLPQAHVTFSPQNDACEGRVVFHKLGSQQQIATQWGTTSSDIPVFRLSPGLEYNFSVSVRSISVPNRGETSILEIVVAMPQTAWPWLTGRTADDPGLVTSLTGAPTWGLFTLDVHSYVGQDPTFSGFVTVDNDGDVVWLWNISSGTPDLGSSPSHVIDQLPDFSFAVQTMVADTPLEVVSSEGSVIHSFGYEPTCGIVTHEARLNGNKTTVISVAETWFSATGQDLPQIGDKVVEWDFSSGVDLRVLYDISDYFNASTERGFLSDGVYSATCNGTTESVNDWTHMNTVSVSAFDGSLIVSIRHFSTVCSFLSEPPSDGTSGLLWCVSSELADRSNFTFVDEADMFFQQHAVLQLANGNLLFYDNGNARVDGGYAGGGVNSRGVEYALDWGTMEISLVWEYPTIYNSHQGSNSPLNNGHSMILVPTSGGDAARKEHSKKVAAGTIVRGYVFGSSLTIEVDSSGTEVSSMLTNVFDDTPYRGISFETIAGEAPI